MTQASSEELGLQNPLPVNSQELNIKIADDIEDVPLKMDEMLLQRLFPNCRKELLTNTVEDQVLRAKEFRATRTRQKMNLVRRMKEQHALSEEELEIFEEGEEVDD